MDRIYTFNDLENIQKFVRALKHKAKKLNIKLEITSDKFVNISDNIKCGGYFESKNKYSQGTLATATGMEINKWLPVLVHESCHMDQWNEDNIFWKRFMKSDSHLIDRWLEGEEMDKNKVYTAIDISRELELDCEKRSVLKIIEFNLPIDIKEYIQKANCYVFFYNHIKKTRRWSIPGNSPYSRAEIYKEVSDDWYLSYEVIPRHIEKLFFKYKV
jgi:hypothetical protein